MLLIRRSIGEAATANKMLGEDTSVIDVVKIDEEFVAHPHEFQGTVSLKDLSFRYPNSNNETLSEISLEIEQGQVVALVGPSGSGKTTLVDILLGLINPDKGIVLISGQSPRKAINLWPGKISYVPQDVRIIDGTIRENISVGYQTDDSADKRIFQILEITHLSEFVSELPKGLDQQVGDRGTNLSGGQRQRIGIARSLFTEPKLLVMDEATNALDPALEADLTTAIDSLKGKITLVIIAHRLSTIRNADKIVYLKNGRIIGSGNYADLKKLIPDFDKQLNAAP
jgi:ABC-type bacteriocin/lantibiotic exporter with double-glycine peptidase domain